VDQAEDVGEDLEELEEFVPVIEPPPEPIGDAEEDLGPLAAAEQTVNDAMERTREIFDLVSGKPKACHCTCSKGPDGSRCVQQFSEQEIEQLR
jgi:hypothetical protein